MPELHSANARLHALIGDAANTLSPAHIQRIAATLAEAAAPTPQPALLAHLLEMKPDRCANGSPWGERRLNAGRCNDLANASRCLYGLTSVLRLLHAAQLTASEAEPDQQLGACEIDGLLHAARSLADSAASALQSPTTGAEDQALAATGCRGG